MEARNESLRAALTAAELGYRCIPCLPDTKVPAIKWKRYQSEVPTEAEYREWFRDARRNIALITTGLVIFDCDDPTQAELVIEQCGDTPHRLLTPGGGIHLGYRSRKNVVVGNHVRIKGLDIDIRAENGLEMLPPSRIGDGEYRWLGDGLLPRKQLPVAKIGWTRQRTRRVMKTLVIDDVDRAVRRARAYLATIPGAVAGNGGHNTTFRVACTLAHRFGLGFEQAWSLLCEWNMKCEPLWSERELEHKLRDAFKKR
jgi:hypothetical protein